MNTNRRSFFKVLSAAVAGIGIGRVAKADQAPKLVDRQPISGSRLFAIMSKLQSDDTGSFNWFKK